MTLSKEVFELLDTIDPSGLYLTQEEQWDAPDAAWTLRYRYDDGNANRRILTDKELRTILIKALAYDELMKIGLPG